MLDTGIPSTFIRWIWSFFIDLRARVQLFNVFSSSRRFTQDLPQGSVLTLLIFLFYINNLASSLNNNAVIAHFADDVSILTTVHKKEDAEVSSKLRRDVEPGMENKFERWQKWGMSLLYLVQRQYLESNYLYWCSESSR